MGQPQPSLFDRYQVIDIDTHITEPPDVWTARVPRKWGDRVPHIRRVNDRDLWMIGDKVIGGPGFYTAAGFNGTFPEAPLGYDDIPAASYEAKARLRFMDEEGIWAQVIYPNVGGFGSGRFLELGEPELMLDCVRAYNDFLYEWCSADLRRLVPVMATPFWDIAAAVAEIERCARLGYRSVLACSQPQAFEQPLLADAHWDPVWAAAQDAGMSVSFHIGAGDLSELGRDSARIGAKANFSRVSSTVFIDNGRCLADLFFGGVCHRFPRLKFVSVESGVGWLPFYLEAFDWQWQNNGVRVDHPEYDLLPSEYFQRQVYAAFWFEESGLDKVLEQYPGNILYETDYPHPTSMSPGPASIAEHPRDYADRVLSKYPEAVLRQVLHDNAAPLYGLS
jgi:predicted TIM-barrel fold metal-dependent hydrolase